jgi:hypothetical protein
MKNAIPTVIEEIQKKKAQEKDEKSLTSLGVGTYFPTSQQVAQHKRALEEHRRARPVEPIAGKIVWK